MTEHGPETTDDDDPGTDEATEEAWDITPPGEPDDDKPVGPPSLRP